MKEKVNEFCEKLFKKEICMRISIYLSILFFSIMCFFAWKNDDFYYPEKEYQILEKEAIRLIEEDVFSLDVETEYECIIDYYNMQSHKLSFKLRDSDYKIYQKRRTDNKYLQEPALDITVNVADYKAVNKDIQIIRWEKSAIHHIISEILVLIFCPVMLSLIILIVILIVSFVYMLLTGYLTKE